MKKRFKNLFSYGIVGGSAAIVEWITFYVFNLFCNYLVSTIISFVIATTFNYFIGSILTFKDYKRNKKNFTLVFIVSTIGLIFNVILMYLFVQKMHIVDMISKIVSTGIVFIWNYFSRKMFIYKDK